jgi:hypothetical protein
MDFEKTFEKWNGALTDFEREKSKPIIASTSLGLIHT